MAESRLQMSRPFGIPKVGRLGKPDVAPGVRVELRDTLSICTVQPFRGRSAACAARLKGAIGVDLPAVGRTAGNGRDTLVWNGPDMFVAISADPDLAESLRKALAGEAAVVDQSDGKLLLRVSGPDARAVLEKGVTIDLHPRAFAAGHSAMTLLSHLPVQLVQCDDLPTYEIILSRAFAADLWHWLEESAGEFGLALSEDRDSR